ncbi:MAG: glycogen debranching enzyme, partial [Candidatus Hydrogenedentes bacterium]|nr:glycogen debranching enzyme [Candidatus Hydrogenedentota bacterium]
DDVRRFWRGDPDARSDFVRRITGSPDLYQDYGRTPANSVNYVTAHDGFTLRDLVTYTEKRNQANGEENRDGAGENFSSNCGVEGECADPAVNALRLRMQKDFLATLFLSLGAPMLLGGDEFGRTQQGNNNAYCQDNAVSWHDWGLVEANGELVRFCRHMIAFRKRHRVFSRRTFFTGRPTGGAERPDIEWFEVDGRSASWPGEDSAFACRIDGSENDGIALCLLFNPTSKARRFHVPEGAWHVAIDTAAAAPHDIPEGDSMRRVGAGHRVLVPEKGLTVLVGAPEDSAG